MTTSPASASTALPARPLTPAQRWWLMAILGVALALRIGLFALGPAQDVSRAMAPDSHRYVELGQNIAHRGTFAHQSEDPGTIYGPLEELRAQRGEQEPLDAYGLHPEIMRTPGYPFFLGIGEWLGLPLVGMLAVQCVLSVAGILAVCAIGRRLLDSPRAGLIAAAIVALHPADLVSASSVLSETVFTVLMAAGLALTLVTRRPLAACAGGGLLLGLLVLVRPVGIMLGPAVGVWMLVTQRRWKTVPPALALVALSLLPPALWACRNNAIGFGYGLSYVGPLQHFSKTTAFMQMRAEGRLRYPQDWLAIYRRFVGELRRDIRPDETVFAAMNRLAWEKIKARPDLYAIVVGDSAVKFMTDHSAQALYELLGSSYQPSGLRSALLGGGWGGTVRPSMGQLTLVGAWTLLNVVLAGLMLAGIVRLAWQRRWAPLLLLAGILFYFLFATQAHGLERMRVPVLGIQAIAVAAAILPLRAAGKKALPLSTAQVQQLEA